MSGAAMTTIARDRDLRPKELRRWADQLASHAGRPATNILRGEGRVSSEADELWRLQREVETLRMEHDFSRKASA